ENLVPPVRNALRDPAPYVRKTAVLGCAKLFRIAKEEMSDTVLVNSLYELLRDRDTQVIANAIFALNEILAAEGGVAINKNIVIHLLNRLKDFNEWGQTLVLETLARYEPSSDYVLDIMVCNLALRPSLSLS